ncbi:MAG: flagellar filament capping protein FliD [Hyphomicrobiales bacterium]
MADPVRIGNFFSSFDTEAVIQQLTASRSVVLDRLTQQQSVANQQKAALADLQTKFAALLLRAGQLADSVSVSGRTATVSGSGLTASASTSSTVGSFTVDVLSVASGTMVNSNVLSAALDSAVPLQDSDFAIPVSAGTFTIKTATGGTATITVDPATQSLDDVIAAINNAGIGVTATITTDANGRANILKLDSTQGDITLGSGGDTSNFLTATNLLASTGTTSRQSTLGIARLDTTEKMADAAWLGGPPAAGDHSFTINGVTINYNAANDSLGDIITRINTSNAGVTARYDSLTDTIKLQQTATGSLAISLADDGTGGDFLAKTGLLTAAQQLGSNASYSINGGPTRYSATNNITVDGTSLTLTAATTPGSPVTVTVSQDTSAAITTIKNFVAEFNMTMKTIRADTTADQDPSKSGPLSGDSSIRAILSSLRSIVTSVGTNLTGKFRTLSEVGISFGAPGSAIGSTDELQFDEAKFKDALAKDPVSVQSLFSEFKLSATLTPGGTGSITGISGTYLGTKAGTYQITDDGAGNLTAVFTPLDGSAPVTTTAAVTAGGTNTTLIPGMTIDIAAVLQAGTHTITVSPSSESVVQRLKAYMDSLSGTNGVFQKRQEAYDARVKDLDARKEQIQASIDAEMDRLREKFLAMEQAQARAQGVLQALQQAMVKINPPSDQ